MESGRKSLSELFVGNKYFYIPDYQRNYAWEDKQINDFFDDFKANYNGVNKRYYYGTILLQDRGTEGIKEKYDIVDGQQRLTTLIVFIKCLIDRVLKINNRPEDLNDDTIADVRKQFIINKGNYILNLQNDDNDFFHTYILCDNIYSDDFRTPSQKRLYHLKEEFNKKLGKVTDEVALAFLDKIYSTNVLVYLVGSRSEASLIFETTNDRGKLLTNIEKTKSYLMYKASLLDDSEQLLNTIQTRFNLIYQDFASFEGRQIQEDAILQYTFIAYENWTNTGKQKEYQHYMETMKDKVEKMLDANDYEGFRTYVESYTLNLQQSFSIIKKIFSNQTEEFKDLLTLNVLYNFYPLLIKTYKFDLTDDKKEFRKICRLLEIFVFRVYLIQKYLTNKFQSKWFELAKRFNGDYASLGNSIIQLIKNPEVGSDETFISALEDKGFFDKYSSATKNYFFWKYENYLRTNKQPVATPMPHDDLKKVKGSKTNLSIEHIVARKNTEEHSKIIADEGIIVVGHSEKFNKEYLNTIGNLTIDPMSANSSKGKKDVEEKISKYFNRAPYKCQNELEDFMVDGKWRIDSIEKRKNAIIKFAKETWCSYDKYYVNNVTAEDINNIEEDDDSEEENNQ